MRLAVVSAGLLGLAACASGEVTSDASQAIDARRTDAAVHDGPDVDAPPADARATDARDVDAPGGTVGNLALTEIVLAPTGGEMVELYNPGAVAVDLGTYYLSDAPGYFKLPAGVAAVAADTSDFVARFPAGASLAPHAVATVAIDTAANFTAAYPGVTPTWSIGSGTMTVLTTGTPTLTNAGEPVVLFQWNGASDRVADVDIMYAGTPSAANLLVAKTPVDGPDADTTPTAYAADALTLPTQTAPGSAKSTKRIALESAATETFTGGNGLGGHDETSEQTNLTWDSGAYTAPTPGEVPASLMP
ncbi:MAG TPA: lamin tail domain-containing protein [Kofleriaceae bacterium]|nr:lamin tail domain-containing protein [Kofleriaceae bacterium]